MSVFQLNGDELKEIDSFYDNSYQYTAPDNSAVYYHNDVSVSKTDYKTLKDSYDKLSKIEVGRSSSFDDLYCEVGDINYSYYFDHYEAYNVSSDSTSISIANNINELPVTRIGAYFLDTSNAKTLNIPANITNFYYSGLNGSSVTTINVDASNPYYSSKDGVMYSKDMSTLVKFPTAKNISTYSFTESVTEIGRFAFAWCSGVNKIVLPEQVEVIRDHAFYCCSNLSSVTFMNPHCDIYDDWDSGEGITICNSYDSSSGTGNYLGVIYGYDDSYAQSYAENFDRTFISLGALAVEGDCNDDGIFSIADAVSLQNFLLGRIKTLGNWKNADLCKDDRLDAFDMILMRRLLIERMN